MNVNKLNLFIVIYFLSTFANVQTNLQSTDVILCRSCGHDISSNRHIFSKLSPNSYYNFNDTLFGKDEVLVEVFLTNIFFYYPVLTLRHATCTEVGEWDEETSWYPGYRWKPCVCPECGDYIGWVFEPIPSASAQPSETFYGLILNSLISETLINSLVKYPDLSN